MRTNPGWRMWNAHTGPSRSGQGVARTSLSFGHFLTSLLLCPEAVTGCMLERGHLTLGLENLLHQLPQDVILSNSQQHRVSGFQCLPRHLCFHQFQGSPRLGTCHCPAQGISCSLDMSPRVCSTDQNPRQLDTIYDSKKMVLVRGQRERERVEPIKYG